MDKGAKLMTLVFICHPWRGNVENEENTKMIVKDLALVDNGIIPISTGIMYNAMLDDNNPHERKVGIRCGLAVLARCDEMWMYSQNGISEGMREEFHFCEKNNIKVYTFDSYPWENRL